MTTQRKPKAPTPHEVDWGGRVFYVEAGKVYEGRRSRLTCGKCAFGKFCDIGGDGFSRRRACAPAFNGRRGNRALHPVQAVG